jgi:hypothetical protein
MPDTASRLADLRSYHAERTSLMQPATGPNLFELVPDPPFACVCAELSRLAYTAFEDGDEPLLRAALQPASLELLATFSVDGTQAFAARSQQGQVFVAFRGTQGDPADLGTDVDFRLTRNPPFPGCVHTGFARSMLGLMPALDAFLDRAPSPMPLVLTGHSLGAALATLAASVHPGSHLVTFGSPRVGDADFAAACRPAAIERYVDCCDVVTQVPPEEFLGYAHVGEMRYIDRDGGLQPQGVAARFVTADRVGARLLYLTRYAFATGNVPARELADHAPANYIRALF